MNSGWPTQRFTDARFSTSRTTAASKPTPVWKQKYRPFTTPSPTRSMLFASRAGPSSLAAATGSFGRPMLRANTFVEPPGRTASAVWLPATPVATSFTVPSPPNATTTSTPRLAASWAKRVA